MTAKSQMIRDKFVKQVTDIDEADLNYISAIIKTIKPKSKMEMNEMEQKSETDKIDTDKIETDKIETTNMKITIDPEFKALIRPLSQEEYSALEASIRKEGCRDRIVIWQDKIVDGHNRHAICTKFNIPYQTTPIEFSDREAAKEWIIQNQLARRNLTSEQRDYLIGMLYLSQKKGVGEHGEIVQNDLFRENTAQKIAEQFHVSEATVKRAANFTKALDEIAKNQSEDWKNKILSGEINISKKDIIAMGGPKIQKSCVLKLQKKINSARDKIKEQVLKYETELDDEDITYFIDLFSEIIKKRPRPNPHMDVFERPEETHSPDSAGAP